MNISIVKLKFYNLFCDARCRHHTSKFHDRAQNKSFCKKKEKTSLLSCSTFTG